MTYGDVIISIEGFNERQLDDWRRTRLIGYQIYCSIPEKGKRKKKDIDKWLPLGGDTTKNEISHEDRIERLKAFREK